MGSFVDFPRPTDDHTPACIAFGWRQRQIGIARLFGIEFDPCQRPARRQRREPQSWVGGAEGITRPARSRRRRKVGDTAPNERQRRDPWTARGAEPLRRTTPPLIELGQLLAATRAVETNTETGADLAYLRGRGTSLGGLRPKCSVVDDDGHLAIGKFPSVGDERSVTKGEVLALTLARKAGIDAAQARLLDSDGAPVALIRRFDRTGNGHRLMYVSAATMIGAETGGATEHSYTEIVDALRQYGSQPAADIEALWRRIAFSILITNVDDHLHNHGFLHVDRGQWRLAPAFDINPFPERVRELKTWISGETGPEATIDALMSVIAYFRISPDRAKAILAEVDGAVATWREEGRALGMTAHDLDSFSEAFEHGERQAVRRVLR